MKNSKSLGYTGVFKHLTVGRLLNAGMLFGSFYWSKLRSRPKVMGLPMAISIEPTTACNLQCPECPSGLRAFSRPTGNLRLDFFKSLIDQVHTHLMYLTFYFQGEPFIHKQFLEMVRYAADRGIFTATSTNAHFIDDQVAKDIVASGLNRLIVSIDGTTQEVYEQYRVAGSLDQALEGLKSIVRVKKESNALVEIIIQFLVVKPNEHQLDDVLKLGEEIGVDRVVFKTAQINDYRNGSPLIPDNPKYSRYRKQPDGTFVIKNRLRNECWRMWQSCVITWDGRVVPCCFDKDATHQMGQISAENPLKKIWRDPAYDQFRTSISKSRASIDICTNCTEGTKVFE